MSSSPIFGQSGFRFDINDNGDQKEDIDIAYVVSGLETIDYTIESSGQGCKP